MGVNSPSGMAEYQKINSLSMLESYCAELADEELVAFDTEFVSEDRYRPELCLIQVATRSSCAIIDPMVVGDTSPFWNFLATTKNIVIAHAAREEIRFCHRYAGRPVANLFDVQLAAGFTGVEYPASLATLVQKFAGRTVSKGETRTDWRRRPLTQHQLDYAIQDVLFLPDMYSSLFKSICDLGRESWLKEETASIQVRIAEVESNESWHRTTGASNLPARQMAIVRSVWRWRDTLAKQLDQPPRRILRDDLIVELARRGSADVRRIRAIRGFERRNIQNEMDNIGEAIREALALSDAELPRRFQGGRRFQSPVLTQFLSTAIGSVCRKHQVAPAIVGNSDDVRDLLAYEIDGREGRKPALLEGWRAEVVGNSFRELLAGKLTLRVTDIHGDEPLEFFRVEE